jgi:tripartite-type tricarboxylate transporter receptor subunit TctC
VTDLAGLLQAAKARPGGIAFGTMGEGSPQQLIGELLKQRTGAAFAHVPYAGSGAAIEDLIAGKLPMVITPLASVAAHQDKLRILAVADATRVPTFPAVPAIAETLPGFVVTGWAGFFAPRTCRRPSPPSSVPRSRPRCASRRSPRPCASGRWSRPARRRTNSASL